MKSILHIFLRDESGVTAVEYGLICALLAVALIGGATTLGNAINGTMSGAASDLKNTQ